MTLPRKCPGRPGTKVTQISPVTQACRPMADYLFDEALGRDPSKEQLQAAKQAMMALRSHPGPIGWAVTVLLEGGDSVEVYETAANILLRTASGEERIHSDDWWDSAPGTITSLNRQEEDNQPTLPGIDG